MSETAVVTNTEGLMKLAWLAHGRNRSVYEDKLEESLDPDGIHFLGMKLLHNDVEWRTQWLVKFKGDESPHMLWLDVPLDALDKHAYKLDYDEEEE